MPFPKVFIRKWLMFEFAYYDVTVQQVNYYESMYLWVVLCMYVYANQREKENNNSERQKDRDRERG